MARKFEDAMNRVRNGETRGYGVSSSYDDEEEKRKERSFETALKKRGSFNHFNNSSQPTTYEAPGYAARNYSTPSLMPESTNPYDIALASVTLRNATQPQRVTANGMKETYEKYGPITQSSLPIIQSQMEAEDNFRKAATRQEMLNKKPEYPTLVNLPTGKDDHSYLPGNEYSNYNSMDLALMKAYYENHKPGEQAAIDYAERMNSVVPESGDEWLSATQAEIDRKDKVYEETGKLRDVLPQAQFNTPALNAQNNYDIAKNEWDSKLNEINYAIDSNYYNSVYNAADFDTLKNYNPEAAKTSEAQQIAAALNDDAQRNALDQYKYIKPDEIEVFNYLLNKDGDEKALDYLSKLNLTERRTSAITDIAASAAQKDPVKASAGALAIGAFRGIGILGSAADYIAGNEIDPNAWYNLPSNIRNAVVGQVSQDIEAANEGFMGKVGSFMYGTGMSMGDFVLSLATGNEAAALAIMGAGAASDTTIEAKKRGLSDGQALAIGAIAGAAEVVSEKVSIEALFNSDVKGVQYILKNAFAEGGEEVESDLINTMADLIISGDKNEMNMTVQNYMAQGYSKEEAFGKMLGELAIQYGIDFAGGAISGAVMGAVGSQANYFYENKAGATLNNDETAVNDIVNLGLKSENQATVDLANKVANGQAENYELGRLYAEVNKENNITGKVVDYLMENGETQGRAEEAAYVINKYMTADISENGQSNLTAKEQAILNKPVVQDAMNTVFTDDYQKYADNLRTADDAYSRALEMARNNARPTKSGVDLSNVRSILGNNRSESTINIKDNEIKTDNTVETKTPSVNVVSEKTKYQPKLSEIKAKADFVNEYNNSRVQATLNDVRSIEVTDDGLIATLSDGQKVKPYQITDGPTQALLSFAGSRFGDTQGAEDFIKAYNENVNVNVMWNAARDMILAGRNGADVKTAVEKVQNDASFRVNGKNIPVSFLNNMYTYGVREQARISEAMNSQLEKEATNYVAKGLGIEGLIKEGGIKEQGSYNESTDEITFGEDTSQSRIETLAHETTHMMKKHARDTYNELEKVVLDSFKENGTYQKFYDHVKELYGEEASKELIHEEMIARAMQEMLFNENVINELCKNNRTLAERVWNAIKKAIEELRAVFHGKIGTAESHQLSQDIEALEKAEKLYAKGLKEAAASIKAKNSVKNEGQTKYAIKDLSGVTDEAIQNNIDTVVNMDAVGTVQGKSNRMPTNQAKEELRNVLNNHKELKNDVVGIISDSLRYMFKKGHESQNYAKFLTLIPDVIEKGKVVDYQPQHKTYNYGTVVIAAPVDEITANGVEHYLMGVAIQIDTDANRLYNERYVKDFDVIKKSSVTTPSTTSLNNQIHHRSASGADDSIKNILKRIRDVKQNMDNAVKDSQGNKLSEGQQKYFEDSVVRNEEGNLLVVYHGTPSGGFTVFKNDLNFFTANKTYADVYQDTNASARKSGKTATNPMTYEGYLNITKPFDLSDPECMKVFIDEYIKGGWALGINPYQSDAEIRKQIKDGIDWTEADNLKEFFDEEGYDYDGIILNEGGYLDNNGNVVDRGLSYVTFNSNQFKNIDNLKPTKSPDIRYSKKDNTGADLSKGQIKFFEDVSSELRDDNGSLKRYYHGTETPGFSVFKPSNRKGFTDNYNAIYLTDNENVAKTYTNEKDSVYPLYVKAENPYVVDAKGQTFHNWKVDNYAKKYTDIQLEASSEGHRFAYWHEDGNRKRSYGDFTIEELADKFGEKIGIFDFADDTHIGVIYLDENGNNIPTSTDDCILHAKNNGYDSVVFNNIRDMGRFAEDYESSQVVAVFSPNQVKSIYNENPTENEDIRFSMKEPVEVTKDLIAVHNLDEDKLLKAFELGGFAMPSIAVVKAKEGHTMYGDYSAVFNRDTIDPKKSKLNKIYGSDAYTPTTPQVDYLVDSKKNQQLINTLKDLSNKVDDYFAHDIRTFSSFAYEGESRLSYDEILKKALDSKGMKAAYLESIGKHVNPVQEEVEETLSFDGKEDFYKKILDTYSKERRSDLHELTGQEYMDKYTLDDIKEAVEKNIGKKFPENSKFAKDVVRRNFFNLRDYDSYIKGELKPKKWMSTNAEMTNKAIDEKVDKTEYKKWLESILDGIISGAGIHNGTETFTYAGNRRGFWQTHNKYTLDNLVAAMKKLQSARGERASMTLAQGLQSVVSPEFKSITDLKKNTKNLGQKDKAEYDAILKDINDRIREITAYIYENSNISRYVSGDDLIDEAILNSIKTKSVEQVIKNFEKENLVISEEMAQKLLDIIEDVRNIPTGYFEAKPNRAVGFDEIAYMVIPDDAPQEIIDKLNENNIPYEEYKAMDKQDRLEKLNSHEDVKFSLQDDWDFDWEAAMAESEEEKIAEGMVAQNDVNILEDGFRALKDIKDAGKVNISHNKAVQIAKRYTEKYDSATGAESLATSIEAVFAYIHEHDVSYDDMLRVMRDVTLPVVENIRGDEQFTEEYRDFVKSLKGTSISLNESQKKEVAYAYGSMANFRKAVAGRFNIKEDGVNIDSLWPEIVEQSGYRLDEEENSNSQPIALLELLDQMKSDKGTVNRGMSDNQLALDMALNIYTDCFKEMSMNAAKVNETEVAKRLAETKEILKDTVAKYEDAVDKMYKKMLADTKAQAQAEIDRLTQELRELNNIDTYNRSIDIDKRIVQLNRQKERLEKEIEEGKVRRQTSRQKARENRENSRMRNAIERIVKDLSSRLANPTKNKYIPEELVKTTVDMLECINFDTKEGDNIKEKVKKVKDEYEKLGKSTNENDASDDFDPALYNMITRLKEIFDDGKEGKSVRKLSQKELEDVLTIAKAIQIQVKNANELIRSEIAQQLDETAKGVIDDVRATRKIGNKKFQHWLNSYVNTQLNASRFFNRLVGYNEDSKMIKLFDELNEGQHKMMQIQMETSDIFKDILTDDDEARKITGENEKDWVETPFKDKNGNPIKISKGMRLSLAMHMENEDNLKHIIYGGLTVPDMKLYNQGRRAEAYESSETEIRLIDDKTRLKLFELRDEANNLNDEKYTNQEREEAWEKYKDVVKRAETEARQKLQSIVNGMTDYEKQFLEYAKKYFWEYSGKQINETSMALNGYPKAMVENYFPIATDKNYTKRDIEGLKLDQTLESWGNLKERVHGRNPIYLENILDVISKHSNMVSKYAGLAIPIRNFNRVYNFTLKENGAYKDSVKKSINSQRGVSATKYIENLLTDLQGSRKVDTGLAGDLLSFFRGNYAAAALTMNYGVTIKQASSLPTAAAVIGKDAIKHAIISRQGAALGRTIVLPFWMSKTTKSKMDLIKKYSPLVWYRNQGNSTQELGDLKKQRTLLDFTKPTKKFKELTSNWIQNVDTTTVVTLWDAAEYRVSKDNPELKKGSEEYYKEVAKWFNKTVEDTQPNYTTLQRPDILRNPNEIVKGLSMFKTQSYQNGGLMTDSFGNMLAKEINYKNNPTAENKTKLKKAQIRFANTVAAIFTAQMLFSVMGFIALCIISKPNRYRDENGELTVESITKGIMRDFGSAISGSFLFGSEIYDGFNAIFSGGKYYGIELANLNQISTFVEDGVNLLKSGNDIEKIEKNAFKVINDVSYLAGVPLKNATNLINGVKLHAQDIINGNPLSFDAGYQRTNKQNANLLYNALESGDQDEFDKVYNRMLGEGYSEEDMYNKQGNNNDAGDIVTTKYKEGDIDFDTAVKYYTELGMDEDDAYFKTVKMTTDFQSPYALCVSAISSEDTEAIIDAVNGMLDHGYTKDKLKDYDMPDSIKEQYIDLYNTNKTKAASLKSAILTYYQACGMSREDAAKKVDKWVE